MFQEWFIFLLVVAVAGYLLYQQYRKSTECPACNGTGEIMGLRGREKCRVCNGTGKRQKK
jgi:DnaJ-class molecular chaperone